MSRCRSCGAAMEFVRTPAGKAMPLDADPTSDGNVLVRDDLAIVLGPIDLATISDDERSTLRMPHHATCPDAGNWKGGR